jgi:hypothetical protein
MMAVLPMMKPSERPCYKVTCVLVGKRDADGLPIPGCNYEGKFLFDMPILEYCPRCNAGGIKRDRRLKVEGIPIETPYVHDPQQVKATLGRYARGD